MIIDPHVHVWSYPSLRDLSDKIRTSEDAISFRSRCPELYKASLTEAPVDNSDDLIRDMDRHGVGRACVQARPGRVSNDQVAQSVARHPDRLYGLARVGHDQEAIGYLADPTPAREAAPAEIARCIEVLGFRGVGEIFVRALTRELDAERIADDLDPMMDVVQRCGVPIQFPTAWSQFPGGLFYGNPLWVDEVAARHPRVPIILTKMGRSLGTYFEAALTVAMRNTNVYFDVVGTCPDHLRTAVRAIGARRIMFGTDWSATWRWLSVPADLHTVRRRVVEDAGLSIADQEAILWGTAAELFGIDPEPGA